MRTICRDVSAVSRTLRIDQADLAGARTTRGEIVLYLTYRSIPLEQLTIPVDALGVDHGADEIAVRDYGEHHGLARTLELAGIAAPVQRLGIGGTPILLMRLAPCLTARVPARPMALVAA